MDSHALVFPEGTPKKEAAYKLRETGLPWGTIAEILDSTMMASCVGAKKYAKRHDLPWPVPQPPVKSPPKGQLSYELRAEGFTWTQVAQKAGFDKPGSASYAAKKYATVTGQPWPTAQEVTHGELAYKMRVATRLPWGEIAHIVGYGYSSHVVTGARRYAERESLPWPIKVNSYSANDDLPTLDGKAIYELREQGTLWKEITDRFNRLDYNSVMDAARGYARQTNRPWPIPSRTPGRLVYEQRLAGHLWTEAALEANMDIGEALSAARGYAEGAQLTWPPDPPPGSMRDALAALNSDVRSILSSALRQPL